VYDAVRGIITVASGVHDVEPRDRESVLAALRLTSKHHPTLDAIDYRALSGVTDVDVETIRR